MGSQKEGIGIYQKVIQKEYSMNVEAINALVDMYVKYK